MIDESYVDKIIDLVGKSQIRQKELRDDLIDHFCCLVEMDLDRGMAFEVALERAYSQTCPNGLDEIHKETLFLLNYNRILFMKRLTYLIGFLSSLALASGMFFKILHLPGASELLLVGTIGMIFLFLPLILVNKFKHLASQSVIERMKWIFGALSAVTFGFGTVFKILHYQGAGLLLGFAFLFFCLGFLPLLFFRMYKKSIEEL